MTRAAVEVEPHGVEVDVTITRDDGGSFSAYAASSGGSALTWPQTIDERTTYWFDVGDRLGDAGSSGLYLLSALKDGNEVAGPNGRPQPFHVGGRDTPMIDVALGGTETLAERETAATRRGGGSYQPLASDLNLDPDVGTSDAGDTDFLAAVMGNVIGEDLTQTHNYLGGVIGAYSVLGTKSTVLPAAAVLAIASDGVTDLDGIVTAMIDGSDPPSETRANAAFAARMANADAASGVDYGLDLHGEGIDVFTDPGLPLDIAKADVRMSNEVCVLNGAASPTDGGAGTGAGFAGPGSLYIDTAGTDAYINAGSKASPTWKLITRAA